MQTSRLVTLWRQAGSAGRLGQACRQFAAASGDGDITLQASRPSKCTTRRRGGAERPGLNHAKHCPCRSQIDAASVYRLLPRSQCSMVHCSCIEWTLQVREFKAHKIDAPSNTVTTSKEELLKFFENMTRYRRMEIAADMLYKAKMIRGFCHL